MVRFHRFLAGQLEIKFLNTQLFSLINFPFLCRQILIFLFFFYLQRDYKKPVTRLTDSTV